MSRKDESRVGFSSFSFFGRGRLRILPAPIA
jgi:hypothetical protein